MVYVLVAIGCGLGGVCRYLGMTLVNRWLGEKFPWGTLVVNCLGSLLLGGIIGSGLASQESAFAFAGVGFCGGLTTFSTFCLQNLTLLSRQERGKLAANIAGSVLLCLVCVAIGFTLAEGRGG